MPLPPQAKACVTAAALCLLLLANSAVRLSGSGAERLFQNWRAFDDFAIAAGYAARGLFPVAPYRVRDYVRREKDPRFSAFKDSLLAEIAEKDLRPIRFWKTFSPDAVAPDGRWLVASRFDDTGRALFLGMTFRALRGAAPFLLFWLGVLAALPVVAWIAWEFAAAGRGLTGVIFLAATCCSAFVLDVLALGYSAAAFHLVGLLVLVALATYAVLGQPTVRGLLLRAAASGVALGICALCRGTVPFLLPGFALALVVGDSRVSVATSSALRRGHRIALWGAAMGLLLVPYVGLRAWSNHVVDTTRDAYGREPRTQYHDAALLLWKGLGDFDRTKGYGFRDKAGEEAIVAVDPDKQAHRDSEVRLRDVILSDVRADPLWLAEILGKRLLATVSLYKLWPWAPRDGISFFPATSANEGVIDNYYTLTKQADWFALGRWSGEAPMLVLLAPVVVLLAAAAVPAAWPRLAAARADARRSLLLLACVALAVLPVPVVITTATALETECFVLVHFLALALLAETVRARGQGSESAARHPP
ncbi:MAG TPA: hypothetical protein VFT38_02875 [Vicinamibacteria bacterium]|nr:hypothetical protein [Vicinamibacteria bacterium]